MGTDRNSVLKPVPSPSVPEESETLRSSSGKAQSAM